MNVVALAGVDGSPEALYTMICQLQTDEQKVESTLRLAKKDLDSTLMALETAQSEAAEYSTQHQRTASMLPAKRAALIIAEAQEAGAAAVRKAAEDEARQAEEEALVSLVSVPHTVGSSFSVCTSDLFASVSTALAAVAGIETKVRAACTHYMAAAAAAAATTQVTSVHRFKCMQEGEDETEEEPGAGAARLGTRASRAPHQKVITFNSPKLEAVIAISGVNINRGPRLWARPDAASPPPLPVVHPTISTLIVEGGCTSGGRGDTCDGTSRGRPAMQQGVSQILMNRGNSLDCQQEPEIDELHEEEFSRANSSQKAAADKKSVCKLAHELGGKRPRSSEGEEAALMLSPDSTAAAAGSSSHSSAASVSFVMLRPPPPPPAVTGSLSAIARVASAGDTTQQRRFAARRTVWRLKR